MSAGGTGGTDGTDGTGARLPERGGDSVAAEIREVAHGDPAVHGAIERAADELFREYFGVLPWDESGDVAAAVALPAAAGGPGSGPGSGETASGLPERWFEAGVAGHVVGFARVLSLGEYLHLEQLSVAPACARRGIGGALVERVLAEAAAAGYSAVTLRTFAEVPWNAPFYARHGFRAVAVAPSEYHERFVRAEEALGLLAHGERVHMLRELS